MRLPINIRGDDDPGGIQRAISHFDPSIVFMLCFLQKRLGRLTHTYLGCQLTGNFLAPKSTLAVNPINQAPALFDVSFRVPRAFWYDTRASFVSHATPELLMSSIPTTTARPRRLGRSVWALFAGFLFVVILSLVTDALFHKLGVFPPSGEYTPDKPFLLATAYRVIFGIIGSYITARLAPHSPMRHALIGGCIGILLGTLGAAATWNRNLGPHWYPVALIVFALPQSWLGAKLFLRSASTIPYRAT
jgi:hypothetical protein